MTKRLRVLRTEDSEDSEDDNLGLVCQQIVTAKPSALAG